jgi:DNA-binding Lrp family transcriptional regulator
VQSGGPPIDFLDIQILALLDKQPFRSAYLIADALCVSHAAVVSHLRELLGLKIFISDPHELTTNLQQIRMEAC